MEKANPFCFFTFIRPGQILAASCLALLTFVLCTAPLTQAQAKKPNNRYASIVMDADTGMILHQRHADKKLHPASLTKVMTLMMAFEAMERGKLRLNDRIRISRYAASMVPSKLGLPAGSSIRVQDAIYALVTKSANDVAVAMAEHLGGTEKNFAHMMTRHARMMGMNSTTFRNASGLHDPRQISTARDISKLARTIIVRYPQYYRYFSKRNFSYAGRSYRNHNRLMDKYKGMDGMKTGYIEASGFNLVASAVRGNKRLIGVVFGGRSAYTRNKHMAKLLDSGFARVNEIRVASARMPVPPRKPGIVTALNSLGKVAPASGVSAGAETQRWAVLNPAMKTGMFSKLIGEGDYDPAVSRRIETGLIAIAAHKGEQIPKSRPVLASYSADKNSSWAVQIGAFTSRARTDKVLADTLKKLPQEYAKASPMIAPLKTRDGWLFRGRLLGYSRAEAFQACKYLSDCVPVAPQAN